MTFIALDVGNTRRKWALYDSHRPNASLLSQAAVFLEHIDRLAEQDWKEMPAPTDMLGCIVASDALRRRVISFSTHARFACASCRLLSCRYAA